MIICAARHVIERAGAKQIRVEKLFTGQFGAKGSYLFKFHKLAWPLLAG